MCNIVSIVLWPTERIHCSGDNIRGTSEHYQWTEYQAEVLTSLNRMWSRICITRHRNFKQNLYHLWSECQAEFLSSVKRLSSKLYIICDGNVKQSFCHPWSQCQADFLLSVVGISSRVSIIRERNVKQSFCHPWTESQAQLVSAHKNTYTCRNFPVTVVLEYLDAISTKTNKTHNSPHPILRYTRRPWNFRRTYNFAALLTGHFPFSSLSTDFSAHSHVFCDVKLCEANIVTCALPQQKLHSKCKSVCSFVNVLIIPPTYRVTRHSHTTSGVPRGRGFGGVQTPPPPPRNSEGPPKSFKTQPGCENC